MIVSYLRSLAADAVRCAAAQRHHLQRNAERLGRRHGATVRQWVVRHGLPKAFLHSARIRYNRCGYFLWINKNSTKCQIYPDVEGAFTSDPRIVKNAK